MVKRTDRILIITLSLFAMVLTNLHSAENPVISLDILPAVSYNAQTEAWTQALVSSGTLSFKSKNAGNVRGEIALTYPPTTKVADAYIKKAYLKAKFPSFRLTMGKTRLSWGDGALFNAADILFGSSSTTVDLTQSELRSDTKWLVSANIPLDSFSFVEVVTMPSTGENVSDISLGGRIYTTFGSLKLESGYARVRESATNIHKGYISLQGNVGADWNLSSSVGIKGAEDIDWNITGGLFYLKYLENDKVLTLRLEFLARPLGTWNWGPVANDASCPLLIYPEITYAPRSNLAFSLRSIISPFDLSAMTTFATSWNVFEGFSLIGYVSAKTGDAGDLFSWKSTELFHSSLAIAAGASWIF
ncbi:hypothetical protein SpiGrapes_2213 [Sphaerochaeta pleomorpha str. Grapes]|uniref:Uncharacterized protein n=1 Tax=Sphaerochaeta pleomorpha (strain ATCC BAA-1885 / DSM 22778 / Grapes) TaxID=158190 RepID=G8QRZ1_SPHPG|nr:hypothetical protein [Sphaerochaeta pleomorpha]AEV29989.1 hypothetical protein SpiGrapes_2213 [Sphaerochaeta pleomorpha str. Grapes]